MASLAFPPSFFWFWWGFGPPTPPERLIFWHPPATIPRWSSRSLIYLSVVVIGSPPFQWTPHYQFSEKLSIKLRNVDSDSESVERKHSTIPCGWHMTIGAIWQGHPLSPGSFRTSAYPKSNGA